MTDVDCHPLTADRWDDLVALFGAERGASGGCWCMYWRSQVSQKAFYAGDRGERRDAFRTIVEDDAPAPGVLACVADQPVGWVAVAPRSRYPRFQKSKASALSLSAEDADSIWAITCFFIAKEARGTGLMRVLVDAAVAYATSCGATAVDAAPLDVRRKLVAGEGFVGVASVFSAAGFKVIQATSAAKPLMRVCCRGAAA